LSATGGLVLDLGGDLSAHGSAPLGRTFPPHRRPSGGKYSVSDVGAYSFAASPRAINATSSLSGTRRILRAHQIQIFLDERVRLLRTGLQHLLKRDALWHHTFCDFAQRLAAFDRAYSLPPTSSRQGHGLLGAGAAATAADCDSACCARRRGGCCVGAGAGRDSGTAEITGAGAAGVTPGGSSKAVYSRESAQNPRQFDQQIDKRLGDGARRYNLDEILTARAPFIVSFAPAAPSCTEGSPAGTRQAAQIARSANQLLLGHRYQIDSAMSG